MSEQISAHVQSRFQRDQALLEAIKANLPQLESLLAEFLYEYEDRVYRFYHQSFKVHSLQNYTLKAMAVFKTIADATHGQLCSLFEEIVADGTGIEFEMDHNKDWLLHTRPIVEAFLHAKYFLEMMVKYGREIDSAPIALPAGWAAILELYKQR